MLFSSVDLPAPRKPDRMVTGSLLRLPAPTGRLTSSRQPLKHGKGLPKCHSSRTNTMYPSRSTSRHWSTQYMRYTAAVSVVQSVHCVDARHAASILTKLADLHDCAEHVQQRQRWSLAALLAAAQLGSADSAAWGWASWRKHAERLLCSAGSWSCVQSLTASLNRLRASSNRPAASAPYLCIHQADC